MRSMVQSGVRKAFRLIGDLAIDLEFTDRNTSGFDFATGSAVMLPESIKIIKAVIVAKQRKDPSAAVVKDSVSLSVLIKTEDFEDPDQYDSFKYNGIVYTIVKPIINNGYTIRMDAVKGAA